MGEWETDEDTGQMLNAKVPTIALVYSDAEHEHIMCMCDLIGHCLHPRHGCYLSGDIYGSKRRTVIPPSIHRDATVRGKSRKGGNKWVGRHSSVYRS